MLVGLRVSFEQMIGVKEASRRLPKMLAALEREETELFVVTRRGRPAGVLLSVERYAELVRDERRDADV